MSLSRCLLSSAVLAGAVFCGTTLPLASFGSKPVTVQFEEKPVFVGKVEEFAGPYLGLATAISLAVGVSSLATAGWRHSSRKLNQVQAQMSTLKQQLSEKEALLEDLKFSDQRLSAAGLEFFLKEDDEAQQLPQTASIASFSANTAVPSVVAGSEVRSPEAHYVVVGTEQPSGQATHPALLTSEAQTVAAHQLVVPATKMQAATALASAQAFMSFARPAQTEEPASAKPENVIQLNELLSNLKQVMTQIEHMQVVSTPNNEPVHVNSPAWQHQLVS